MVHNNMKKGDWLVCVTDEFVSFTKGNKYQLLRDANGTVLELLGDTGHSETPVIYGVRRVRENLQSPEFLERVYYFMPIEDYRDKIINEILK